LILHAARAARRLIAGRCDDPDRRSAASGAGRTRGPGGPASPLAGGSLCPHAVKKKAAKITKSGRRMNHRIKKCGSWSNGRMIKNVEAVLDPLEKHGIEIIEDGVKLIRKPRR